MDGEVNAPTADEDESFPGLYAREGDVRAERVAEFHRTEPVQFEEAVEGFQVIQSQVN